MKASGALWAGLVLLVSAAGAGAQQVQVSASNRTIEVVTTDSAERRADVAVVHIGYQVYAATSEAVYTRAAGISKAVAAALDQLGIPKQAVESNSQSTGPVQDYVNNGRVDAAQRQFQAEQSWSVHAEPDSVAKVLAAAVEAGANQSGNIDWSLKDNENLGAEAAAAALKHARSIAQSMAAGLGAKLGPLVYASNQADQPPRAFVNDGPAQMIKAAPAREMPKLSLNPPMQRSSATVRAIFALE